MSTQPLATALVVLFDALRMTDVESVGGKNANPFMGPYCASKFGLEGMSEALRREQVHRRVVGGAEHGQGLVLRHRVCFGTAIGYDGLFQKRRRPAYSRPAAFLRQCGVAGE